MAQHYVKILDWLKSYADICARLPAESWQQTVFDDVTARGTSLRTVPIDPDNKGPRVGIIGKRFFCEAGYDEQRDDTLFICRIEGITKHGLEIRQAHIQEGEFFTLISHGLLFFGHQGNTENSITRFLERRQLIVRKVF